MPRRQSGIVEPELGERPRPEVLHDDVASSEQPIDDGAPFGPLEIERDAYLVAVDAQIIRALAVDERRPPGARVVALSGLLDLDHASAHVGEQHRAVRTRQHAREIENGQAFERRHNGVMQIIVYAGSA